MHYVLVDWRVVGAACLSLWSQRRKALFESKESPPFLEVLLSQSQKLCQQPSSCHHADVQVNSSSCITATKVAPGPSAEIVHVFSKAQLNLAVGETVISLASPLHPY